jgi:hypothetical protein
MIGAWCWTVGVGRVNDGVERIGKFVGIDVGIDFTSCTCAFGAIIA